MAPLVQPSASKANQSAGRRSSFEDGKSWALTHIKYWSLQIFSITLSHSQDVISQLRDQIFHFLESSSFSIYWFISIFSLSPWQCPVVCALLNAHSVGCWMCGCSEKRQDEIIIESIKGRALTNKKSIFIISWDCEIVRDSTWAIRQSHCDEFRVKTHRKDFPKMK